MTTKEYNECVDLYADNIYRFVLKHLKNNDLAKDVVQDTFAKVWLKKEGIDTSKARSYFFTTARHTLIDVVRKEKVTTKESSIDKEYSQRPISNLDLQSQFQMEKTAMTAMSRISNALWDLPMISVQLA